MPELTQQLENSRFAEATPFHDGDQLDFNLEHASEGRASASTIEGLSRAADHGARKQFDQLKIPEITIYQALLQTSSIIDQMRDYEIGLASSN